MLFITYDPCYDPYICYECYDLRYYLYFDLCYDPCYLAFCILFMIHATSHSLIYIMIHGMMYVIIHILQSTCFEPRNFVNRVFNSLKKVATLNNVTVPLNIK